MRKSLGAIFLLFGLALTTACGDATASSGPATTPATPAAVSASGAQQVTVEVVNGIEFRPAALVVRAGEPVELTLRNEAPIPHDFVLTEGVAQPVRIVAEGRQTAVGRFTLEKPGTYPFICSVPGHEAAGMKGTITAQ